MSKDFAMAHAIKKMNQRKKMAEGGEVKEKSFLDKAKEVYYGGIQSQQPKREVKDPIDMQVGKHQFEKRYAEGGLVEGLMSKRKMMSESGMAENEDMPIDHDSSHEDFLSAEDDQSANLLEKYEGKDKEDIFDPMSHRKSVLNKMFSAFKRR